ncbi:MAG: serine hydrolase domain-containing protein [Chloroflexota bacterium]
MLRRLFIVVAVLLLSVSALAQESFVTEDDLRTIIQDYVSEDTPGMVIVVEDYGEIYAAAGGAANVDTSEPLQTDDYFRIGSMTKPMLAATVLSLVEDGELSLDDPLADYVPGDIVAKIANAEAATVREALQMTSGITDYLNTDAFFDTVEDDPTFYWTAETTLEFAYGLPADFAPSTDYEYSNSNYNLLHIAIETVTGQPLVDVMEARVFSPVGMDTCYLETQTTFAQNIVRGYEDNGDGTYFDMTEVNDGVGMGDGGVVCTAPDLVKFLPALVNGDIIGDEMLTEMLTPVDDGEGGQYGLGISYEDDPNDGLMIFHGGATNGFEGMMMQLVDEELTVVVLTNMVDNDNVTPALDDAISLAFGDY